MEPSNISTSPFCEQTVQVCQCLQPFFADICNLFSCKIFVCLRWHLHARRTSPDARRSCPGRLWKYLRSPCPLQISTRRGCSVTTATVDSLQILLSRIGKEGLYILRIDNDCHTLLRLGNRKLRAIQSCIFLRYLIQINLTDPAASSPIATDTPPAPKSLHFLMRRLTSGRRNSL